MCVVGQVGRPFWLGKSRTARVAQRQRSRFVIGRLVGSSPLWGCRLGITYPEIYEMQTEAIIEAAANVRKRKIRAFPEIMIPLVGTVRELADLKEMVDRVAAEVATRRTYVMAHAHTASAARRCVDFGVRSIEHGTLIDRKTAEYVAASDAFVVPTLSTIRMMKERGPALGLPKIFADKLGTLFEDAQRAVAHCQTAGVKLGLGSDLIDRAAARIPVDGACAAR